MNLLLSSDVKVSKCLFENGFSAESGAINIEKANGITLLENN